jgi:hypothetical protein
VPGTVQAAAIVTWVCCGITAVMTLFFVAASAFVGSIILGDFQRTDRIQLIAFVAVAASVSFLGSALACWFAWLVWRRREWARIALVVSSAVALVLSVLTFGPHTVFVAPGSVAVVVLLFLPQSNDWFRDAPLTGAG